MTEDDFIRIILEAPDDDAPRLVYADWLEEQSDPRGELLRITTEREALEAASPPDMRGRLSRVRRIAQLSRRWRELVRPEHLPWLAVLHRSPIQCGGVPDGGCPRRWDRLPPEAARPFTRFCRTCNRWVYLCWSRREAKRTQRWGWMVALAVVMNET